MNFWVLFWNKHLFNALLCRAAAENIIHLNFLADCEWVTTVLINHTPARHSSRPIYISEVATTSVEALQLLAAHGRWTLHQS